MNKKTKTIIGLTVISVFVLGIIGAVCYKRINKCNDVYLNICFDKDSNLYMANLEKEMSNGMDFIIVDSIRHLEENNIKFLGYDSCGWCKKQKEEFGSYWKYVVEKGIYEECTENPICENISGTPSWYKDGNIIAVGYKPIGDLIKLGE